MAYEDLSVLRLLDISVSINLLEELAKAGYICVLEETAKAGYMCCM
jgi:hypothetical protein